MDLERRLEQGEVHVASKPFALPCEDDRTFLRDQELFRGKEIVFDTEHDRLAGVRLRSADHAQRLKRIFLESQAEAARWLASLLPHYGPMTPARTSWHVAEEATRCLRVTARNDLLHVDALHQAAGRRLLRLCVNLHPTDPRVWARSETMTQLFAKGDRTARLIKPEPIRWPIRLGSEILRYVRGHREPLHPHDRFMLEFARSLKHSDEFQDKAPRTVHSFAPETAWLAFTDGLVHADLRGRWVLDHLFLIPVERCASPADAPLMLYHNRHELSRAA